MMRRTTPFLIALTAMLLTTLAAGQTLTGRVNNPTTGKPAAGDEVGLLSPHLGMEESGKTKTDANGNFSFKLANRGPHLIRAIHQGATYLRMVPPGTTSVDMDVYDVSQKVDGITAVADVMYLLPVQGQLAVTRQFWVQNNSNPPRTQMSEKDFEFYLPEGARIVDASAVTETGNPLRIAPAPEDERNRYSFDFPLRPGVTSFQVRYLLPYSGSANIDPKSIYPLKHFLVAFPKTMQFKAAAASNFQSIESPKQPDSRLQAAADIPAGRNLAFSISGAGKLEGARQSGGQAQGLSEQPAVGSPPVPQSNARPGGGLGVPIDAPDPLQEYRWWILGGLAGIFLVGATYVMIRRQKHTLHSMKG